MITLAELAALLPGARLVHAAQPAAVALAGVSTDSRAAAPGALFVALRGPRHDGHDHAAAAQAAGAAALLVERELPLEIPQLVVADTRAALGLAAAGWRARFALPLIAVTGSNGKTTVTQMLAAILAQAYGDAGPQGAPAWLATRGNLNNEIGVPLTLWRLRGHHRAAAVELGTNHPGEIAALAAIARPTVALVNNAQREHQEFFASAADSAEENAAAIRALPPEGVAVFPADDPCAPAWRRAAGGRRVLDFALAPAVAAVTGTAGVAAADGSVPLEIAAGPSTIAARLAVAGRHHQHNALAAAAAALAAGVPAAAIGPGLSAFRPVGGRGVRHLLASGAELLDDSYNANPDSMRAAIELLAGRAGRPRVLVLGDMGEVGERGPAFHQEIGAYARACGIERLLATGPAMRAAVAAYAAAGEGAAARARHFDDPAELLAAVRAEAAASGASVLVKGSRVMQLDRVVAALAGAPAAGPG